MPDKNFRSYEELAHQHISEVTLFPARPQSFNDTMKVFRCTESSFREFVVEGCREDCVDVGRETRDCTFDRFLVSSGGQYILTVKGGSHHNKFIDWLVGIHGQDVDIEIGNWHSLNFEPSVGNYFELLRATDGKPVTYCYRLGCKPTFHRCHVKHLWWRSIGLTVYWWAKYFWHRILKRPDNF